VECSFTLHAFSLASARLVHVCAQVSPDKAAQTAAAPAWNIRLPEPMAEDADVAKVPVAKAVKSKRGGKNKAEEAAALPLADISQAVPKAGKRSAK
jgi:hypothetical protein